MTGYGQVRVGVHGLTQNLELSEIEEVVKVIEAEQEAEAERRRTRLAATASAEASINE